VWRLFAFSAAVTIPFDKDGLSVVQKTVEQSGSHGSITGKDSGPVLEGDIGGDDDGAVLVAFGDNLEQQLSPSFIQGGGIRARQ
jgi:hypothetical protein